VRKNELLLAVLVALVIIVVGVTLGWENNKVVPVNATPSAHYLQESHNHLGFLVNWDGPIYLSIAQHGYTSGVQANFFPLYPLLVRIVHGFVSSLVYSGLAVAWTSLVGAIYFYLKIIKQLYGVTDNAEALRGVVFFILFPTSVFLIATYTESLFALLALGATYYALRGTWLPAALLTMLSTATHVNGLFVVVLVSLLLLEAKVQPAKIVATAAIGSFGLAAYMVFQNVRFHDPLEFLVAQKNHSWFNFSAMHVITELLTLNGMFLILLVIAALYWRRQRKSFSLYSLLYAAIVLLGGKDLSGLGRYALMAFPAQLMLYDYLRNRRLGYSIVLALSSVFWTFFTLRYVGGYTGG
jgi:Gpi18-like mannosyltransferase